MPNSKPKIVECKIGPYPKKITDMEMPKVHVVFDDGVAKQLFEFYPDEISFRESEFVGMTEEEAYSLRQRRDIAYIRS